MTDPQKKSERRKKWPWVLLFLLLLTAAGTAGGLWWWINAPASQAGAEPVIFTVNKGSGVKTIANSLQQSGLLKDELPFILAVKLQGSGGALKAGQYSIKPGASPWELAIILKEGRTNLYRLPLPEGYNMAQIIERLSAPGMLVNSAGQNEETNGIINKEEALKLVYDRVFISSLGIDAPSLEGYLFPDTYFFTTDSHQALEVLERLTEQFEKNWAQLKECAKGHNLTRHQLVTLASIIEKETGVDAERPLVSAVYHNRLRIGMPLQADPTVLYGSEQTGGPITRRQLETDHPYNTYTRPGLPPGPICSPGLASLKAACSPAHVDYLYFVATGEPDGSHNFARTHQEHLKNVAIYRARVNRR